MPAKLTENNETTLKSLAERGDIEARSAVDQEAKLDALEGGSFGPLIIVRLATAANADLSGLDVIDGVQTVANDLVLVKNHATPASRGLYKASAGAWTRLTDISDVNLLKVGMLVSVQEGNTLAGTLWMQTDATPTYAQNAVSGASAVDLASTANGKGASLIGLEDALGLLAAGTVEAAVAELVKYEAVALTDPGTGVAIPVTRSASIGMTIAGTETNTLAIPSFLGQKLFLYCDTLTSGTRAVTCAQAINQAANTIMTFAQARDFVELVAIKVGGALRWQVASNDGVALS